MKRNKIRLTESQLHRVIRESVKKVLNESNRTIDDVKDEISKCETIMQNLYNKIQNDEDDENTGVDIDYFEQHLDRLYLELEDLKDKEEGIRRENEAPSHWSRGPEPYHTYRY